MRPRINPLASDIIIVVYVIITMYLRVKFQNDFNISPINSIGIGLAFLVILVVFIKAKILNPNWFGLFKSKNTDQ